MADPDVMVKCPTCRKEVPEPFVLRDGRTYDVLQCWDCQDAEDLVEARKREAQAVKGASKDLRNKALAAPMLEKVMPEYISPCDPKQERIIHDKKQRLHDMRAHGCFDANDLRPPNAGKFKNDRFIKKHGLEESRLED